MSHKEFLEKFGNAKTAAAAFGVSPLDIGNWKKRGIPCWYWFPAEDIAKTRGWNVTARDLYDTHPKTARK